MQSEPVDGFILFVELAADSVHSSFDNASAAAEPHRSAKAQLRIQTSTSSIGRTASGQGLVAPLRQWNYDYSLARWVECLR